MKACDKKQIFQPTRMTVPLFHNLQSLSNCSLLSELSYNENISIITNAVNILLKSGKLLSRIFLKPRSQLKLKLTTTQGERTEQILINEHFFRSIKLKNWKRHCQ